MSSSIDRLVYMINQIARNFGTKADAEAAEATAEHIMRFWDPGMKQRIISHTEEDGSKLSENSRAAVKLLAQQIRAH